METLNKYLNDKISIVEYIKETKYATYELTTNICDKLIKKT